MQEAWHPDAGLSRDKHPGTRLVVAHLVHAGGNQDCQEISGLNPRYEDKDD